MIEVVHIISGDLWAGAEVQVFHTLCDLKNESTYRFSVILFNNDVLAEKLQTNGINSVILNEEDNNGLVLLWKLILLIRQIRPAIVHVHAYKEHIIGKFACILANVKTKFVRTFHGTSEAPKGLPFIKGLKSNIVHKIEKYLMQNCNIIAVSKDLEEFISSNYPNAFVTQIYNGMPVYDEKVAFSNSKITRKEYDIDDKTLWIGCVARLEEIKNIEMLIEAGKELQKSYVNFRISIFGEGPLKSSLERKIVENNLQELIKLEGFVQQILPILEALDVFVLCSLHEGLPMSILEAMAVGTPVICTSVGGMKEIVTDNYSGLMVPSNNASALSHKINMLQKNRTVKRQLIINAKNEIKQKFNIENTNKKLLQLYQTIT